ncbi:MAG: hypothetical protein C0592_11685 [Marinilabiliales bacterium]|nr:MAG: hypothetical protein C0592_11685 [Marinilabiliales bacterium]
MNSEMYKEKTMAFFEAMNAKNFDTVKDDMHEDISFDFPGTKLLEGQRRVLLFLTALTRKYNDLTFTVSEIIVENNVVFAVWTNKGTAADGSEYKNSGVTLIRFRGDKIEFLSDYFKDTSFTQN